MPLFQFMQKSITNVFLEDINMFIKCRTKVSIKICTNDIRQDVMTYGKQYKITIQKCQLQKLNSVIVYVKVAKTE